jgi:hypothetical protein
VPHRRFVAAVRLVAVLILAHQAPEFRLEVLVPTIGRDPSHHVGADLHDIINVGTVEDRIEGIGPGAKFGLSVFLGCGSGFHDQAARRLRGEDCRTASASRISTSISIPVQRWRAGPVPPPAPAAARAELARGGRATVSKTAGELSPTASARNRLATWQDHPLHSG